MRKYLFIAYPVGLYLIFGLPVLLLSAILYSGGIDLLTANSVGAMGITLLHMRRKRRKMTTLPAMPWKRMFLLTGIMMIPVVSFTAVLTERLLNSTPGSSTAHGRFLGCMLRGIAVQGVPHHQDQEARIPAWVILILPAVMFPCVTERNPFHCCCSALSLGPASASCISKKGYRPCMATHWVYNMILYTFQYSLPDVTALYSATRCAQCVVVHAFAFRHRCCIFYKKK